jgi:hypothetical protein
VLAEGLGVRFFFVDFLRLGAGVVGFLNLGLSSSLELLLSLSLGTLEVLGPGLELLRRDFLSRVTLESLRSDSLVLDLGV